MVRPSLLPLCSLLVACGASPSAPLDASPDVAREAAVDAARDVVPDVTPDVAADAADDVPVCAERPDAAGVTCIRRVRGRVRDTSGAPLGGRVVTWCGPGCWATTSAADGAFVIDVNDFAIPSLHALIVHGRPQHASLYVPSPPHAGEEVVFVDPVAVPRYEVTGDVIPEGASGTFSAGDVALTIAPGTTLEFDVEDAELGELGRRVRTAWVPMETAPRFARDAGVVALWTVAPFGLVASRPMAVRVANRARLAAGAAVDFVVMGTEVTRPPFDGGRALVAAQGRVSSDGMTVSTDPGAGITTVTWIGLRLRR